MVVMEWQSEMEVEKDVVWYGKLYDAAALLLILQCRLSPESSHAPNYISSSINPRFERYTAPLLFLYIFLYSGYNIENEILNNYAVISLTFPSLSPSSAEGGAHMFTLESLNSLSEPKVGIVGMQIRMSSCVFNTDMISIISCPTQTTFGR
jgi:hypothetical protein